MSATNPAGDDLLTLMWSSLIARKWLVASIVAVVMAIVITVTFMMSPVYRVSTVLIPAQPMDGSNDLSSMLGNLGGLASLAGLSLPGSNEVTEAIAILRSRNFTEGFIRDENLLPRLFPSAWDSKSAKWVVGISEVPTLYDGFRKFDRNIRRITQDTKSGLVTLDVEWTDPEEGAKWANGLIQRVNRLMREKAIAEADASVKYLEAELSRTNIVSVEQAIARAIDFHVKRRALASTRPEFAFRTVDPAAAPDPDAFIRPKKALYIVGGFIVGLLMAVGAVLAWEYIAPRGALRARSLTQAGN